jgi:glycosyltransferase involved in cell wall biosynthesis
MLAQTLKDSGHEVHFGWIPLEDGDRTAVEEFFGGKVSVLPYTPTVHQGRSAQFVRRVLRKLGSMRAYVWGLDDWYDDRVSPALAQLHQKQQFDAVIVVYVFMSKALEALPDTVLKVIDTNDRFADRHLHYIRAGQRAPLWYSTTAEEERRGLARAHVIMAIQETENRLFAQAMRGQETKVVTIGHILPVSQPLPLERKPAAVFVGSTNTINQDGVKYFIREVLPRIWEKQPDFELWLVGDICRTVADSRGVVKHGRVDNLAEVYAKAAMAVNPVRFGTGLNIKTVECLALGLPLVVTEAGSRGLEEFRESAFVMVANDDPGAMASAIISFLNDPELAQRYARQAHVAANTWNSIQRDNLLGLFDSAGAARRKVGGRQSA